MRAWIMWVVVAVAVGRALGQATYTDHREAGSLPGADRVEAVISAFNSGDGAEVVRCVHENFSGSFAEIEASEHARVWASVLARWGPVEFEAMRTYEPPREDVVVIVWAPVIEAWRAFVLGIDEDGRFTSLRSAPARAPSYLPPEAPMPVAEAVPRLDRIIDRLAARDMFSGTVVIAKDGEILLERAVGPASRRFDVPNRLDTKFNLGSMNKMFTAVAIAQLAERGALSFDDTVGAHLPEYPNADVRERVRIKHLLSHTSGMGSHFTDEFMKGSKLTYRETIDYLPLFQDTPLAFDPGTDWAYSNAGFYVLGMIVEAASGQSYYDYVREHVYAPAGMADSDSYDMDIPIKNLAIGYTRETFGDASGDDGARWLASTGGLRNNLFMHSIKGGPAGGGFSTSPDLIRFARALLDGTLVSSGTLAVLTSAKPELGSPGYGYGFGVEDHGDLGVVFGHSGGFPGINGMLDIYADQGLIFVALSNLDGGANLIGGRFMEMIETGR